MPVYRELRTSLNEDTSSVTRVTLHVILYGDEDLHQSDNEKNIRSSSYLY